MTGIYKITSPSGKVYIGSSKNIERRIKYYSSISCIGQTKLYNSIKKYGWNNHILEIIKECSFDELYSQERYYGEMYDVLGINGLNLILPKAGENKIGVSNETRLKMSLSKSGDKNTFFGKKHSNNAKEKIRLFQTGRTHTTEHRKKVSDNNAKNLSKIVLDLNTGVFYESAKELSDLYCIKHSTIRARLNGTNKNKTQFIYC
jgi:group I intron endonuclease